MRAKLFCKGGKYGFWASCVKGECDKCGWDKTDMDTACVARYIQMQKDDVLVKFQQYGKASHAEATVATGDSDSDAYGERQKNRDEVQKVDYELPLSEFMQKYREVSAAFFDGSLLIGKLSSLISVLTTYLKGT
jgi:hypothetical protein